MEIVLALLIAFIVLALVSLRWGFDSTEDFNSPEWDKRKQWGAI